MARVAGILTAFILTVVACPSLCRDLIQDALPVCLCVWVPAILGVLLLWYAWEKVREWCRPLVRFSRRSLRWTGSFAVVATLGTGAGIVLLGGGSYALLAVVWAGVVGFTAGTLAWMCLLLRAPDVPAGRRKPAYAGTIVSWVAVWALGVRLSPGLGPPAAVPQAYVVAECCYVNIAQVDEAEHTYLVEQHAICTGARRPVGLYDPKNPLKIRLDLTRDECGQVELWDKDGNKSSEILETQLAPGERFEVIIRDVVKASPAPAPWRWVRELRYKPHPISYHAYQGSPAVKLGYGEILLECYPNGLQVFLNDFSRAAYLGSSPQEKQPPADVVELVTVEWELKGQEVSRGLVLWYSHREVGSLARPILVFVAAHPTLASCIFVLVVTAVVAAVGITGAFVLNKVLERVSGWLAQRRKRRNWRCRLKEWWRGRN